MANTPLWAQLRSPITSLSNSTTNQTVWGPESMEERMLTCLAMFVSGQNPDGTTRGT